MEEKIGIEAFAKLQDYGENIDREHSKKSSTNEKYPMMTFSKMCLTGLKWGINCDNFFTEGKNYPLLESDSNKFLIKTIDNQGKERWVEEDLFTATEQKLVCGELFKNNHPEPIMTLKGDISKSTVMIENLKWNGLVDNCGLKLRKMGYRIPEQIDVDAKATILAGVQKEAPLPKVEISQLSETQKHINLLAGLPVGSIDKNTTFAEKLEEQKHKEMLKDFSHQNIIDQIKTVFPERNIKWDKHLYIDGAKTNIDCSNTSAALHGLAQLTNKQIAEKMVAKIIIKNLKKLF